MTRVIFLLFYGPVMWNQNIRDELRIFLKSNKNLQMLAFVCYYTNTNNFVGFVLNLLGCSNQSWSIFFFIFVFHSNDPCEKKTLFDIRANVVMVMWNQNIRDEFIKIDLDKNHHMFFNLLFKKSIEAPFLKSPGIVRCHPDDVNVGGLRVSRTQSKYFCSSKNNWS